MTVPKPKRPHVATLSKRFLEADEELRAAANALLNLPASRRRLQDAAIKFAALAAQIDKRATRPARRN